MNCFVYKWTHNPTGKWYIGSRTAKNCHINDGYICSSKVVKPMILQNPNEWTRTILATGDKDQMLKYETYLLRSQNAKKDPMSFNMNNADGMPGIMRKGFTKKIKIQKILDAIADKCNESIWSHLIQDYANAKKLGDQKLLDGYHKLFQKKQISLTLNGQKLYEANTSIIK